MSNVYVVTREGVYRHEIVGVHTELEPAKQTAIDAIKAESDDYHTFSVSKYTLNTPIVDDGEVVFTVTRQKDLAERHGYTYVS